MKKIFQIFILVSFFLFLLSKLVIADLSPIPIVKFNIVFKTSQKINLLGGRLLSCLDKKDIDCEDTSLLFGKADLVCQQTYCTSIAFGDFYKLKLNFSDRSRESNIFAASSLSSFESEYDVIVTDDSQLTVKEIATIPYRGPFAYFFRALVITLILELSVGLIYLVISKTSKKVLVYIIIANLISLPLVWFLLPTRIETKYLLFTLAIFEICVVIFESYFIYYFNKAFITLKKSLGLSVLMNIVSSFLGGFIYIILNMLIEKGLIR